MRLNWDRMQYYAVVNSGIIAVAVGLISDAETKGALLLCGALFFIGLAMAVIGISAIHRGRDYYQATIFKKTVLEHALGLHQVVPGLSNPKATLAIATTSGMQDIDKILNGRPPTPFWKRVIRNRVISYFMWFLMLLAVTNIAGMAYVATRIPELGTADEAKASVAPAHQPAAPPIAPAKERRFDSIPESGKANEPQSENRSLPTASH